MVLAAVYSTLTGLSATLCFSGSFSSNSETIATGPSFSFGPEKSVAGYTVLLCL